MQGTGTAVGDVKEISAINAIFNISPADRPAKLRVGSVKSNIGHLEAAAGLAGVLKTILCLEHGRIPAQMHFQVPNPAANFDHIVIPTSVADWPATRDGIRRAAVNCFGAGGTNGHCILEALTLPSHMTRKQTRPYLFMISASSQAALTITCTKYADYVTAEKPHLGDLAYTMLSRRSKLSHMIYFSANSSTEFVDRILKLANLPPSVVPIGLKNICCIFTGQGAQWPEMGAKLFEHSEIFRNTILECEQHLRALSNAPPWKLSEELGRDPVRSNISLVNYAQPLTTALQLGLINLWASWGVRPEMVIGHSSGEIAAAYAAGHLSLRDAIVISYLRGMTMLQLHKTWNENVLKGAMGAVGLSEEQTSLLLRDYKNRVEVAAVNSPVSCTLSGDEAAIEEIGYHCTQAGIFFRKLRVDIAYHSRHVLVVAESYYKALERVQICPLQGSSDCTMFSSVTGKRIDPAFCDARYWTDNMTRTVRFLNAFRGCVQHCSELEACFEIGPHPALQGPISQILQADQMKGSYFASCVRGKCDFTSQLDTAGALLALGIPLDTKAINDAKEAKVLTNLPLHVWNHSSRIWLESRLSHNVRFKRFPRHPLLGSRYTEDTDMNPSWRSRLYIDQLPWEHKAGHPVPEAAFVLMALEAARQMQEQEAPQALNIRLIDLTFGEALLVREFQGMSDFELHLTSSKLHESNQYHFLISSTSSAGSQPCKRHCSGTFSWNETPFPPNDRLKDHHQLGYDPFLLENAAELGLISQSRLKDTRLGKGVATARLEPADDEVDPLALVDLLNLALAAAVAHDPSVLAKLHSIGSIEYTVYQKDRGSIPVAAMGRKIGKTATAAIVLEGCFVAQTILFGVERNKNYKLPLRSLFYRAERRLDITDLPAGSRLTLSDVILLTTHKWPMCDIGFLHMDRQDETDGVAILKSFDRPRFRSLQILDSTNEEIDSSIRRMPSFAVGSQLHLMLAGSHHAILKHIRSAHETGIAFFKRRDACDERHWEIVKHPPRVQQPVRLDDVFVFQSPGIESFTKATMAGLVPLSHDGVRNFCETCKHPYHAIILDDTQQPVTVAWPGEILLPWLQHMLKFSQSVTWITQRSECIPSVSSSTALLRTLQAEQPSLRVRHLVYEANSRNDIDELIQAALRDSDDAFLELQQDVENGQRKILRWFPDDHVSVRVGLLPGPKKENNTVQESVQLSADGTIVAVGGLGGVGRFVCLWLVSHGAKHITVICRSGPHSRQAMSLMKLINGLGGSLFIWKCDARDKQALSKVLDAVRKDHKITGVVNMAMVLSDAPLASMVAADWDGPLRLKVDSSWNLHELTQVDTLDIFILFSSVASVLGNRSQAGYNVGNAFLNSLAEFRRAQRLPAVAIALGAMTDMGVLYELGRKDMLNILAMGGLVTLQEHHLAKILHAAVAECADSESKRAVMLTGLAMFNRLDGRLIANEGQSLLYWTEQPDFGHLQNHNRTWRDYKQEQDQALLTQIQSLSELECRKVIERSFFQFLASLLGFDILHFSAKQNLLEYGIDSLTGVACQYWFYRGR